MKKKVNLNNGVLFDDNSKRRWIDESGNPCFMLYPRALGIVNLDEKYFTWKYLKEISDENIEVIKLKTVCWLELYGNLEISELSPEVDYEVAFMLKLKTGAFGWELPSTASLRLPSGESHARKVCLQEEPRGEWMEVNLGTFKRNKDVTGNIAFSFTNFFGHWKGGMILKGIIIRPKKSIA